MTLDHAIAEALVLASQWWAFAVGAAAVALCLHIWSRHDAGEDDDA